MDRKRSALIIAGAVAIAAGAGALLLSSRARGDGGSGWLSGDGHPVQLGLTFEPERGRAKEITPAGGTISATSSDGTRFELRIPEGALVYPERISVIPIASVHGLPLSGGSIAAVHLKPDGLRLMKPATLSIRPRRDVPVSEQVAFAYTGNGSDAYLYPLSPDPHRIELPIFHFSGYGLGQAPPNDPGRKALQEATNKLARLQSQASEIMAAERALELADDATASDWGARLAPLFVQYYDEVLRPLMITAESDERMAECAMQGFFSWMRQIQLLGLLSDDDKKDDNPELERRGLVSDDKKDDYQKLERRASEGSASLRTILHNAYEKRTAAAVKRCREEHDFMAISEILGLERQAELLGGESNFAEDLDEIEKCLTFEVEFRSVIEKKTPTGEMYYHTLAKLPVSIGLLSTDVDSASLEYVAFRASGNPAKNLTGGAAPDKSTLSGLVLDEGANGALSPAGTRPGNFTFVALEMTTSKKPFTQTNCDGEDEEQERETVDSLTVTFSPGSPMEMVRFTPVHAGETSSLMKVAAGFAEVLGGKAAANEAREKGRIGGAFVMEETGWLEGWSHFHGDDEIKWPGAAPSGGDETRGQLFALNLRPVTPGVWRADFKSEEPPKLGFAQTESGYMIVRHTPK
ncbi:MAG TPA: hypothetical protein VIP79_06175 [Gemmatimonadaceae bacterium]